MMENRSYLYEYDSEVSKKEFQEVCCRPFLLILP